MVAAVTVEEAVKKRTGAFSAPVLLIQFKYFL
jgi:hypothetical protein